MADDLADFPIVVLENDSPEQVGKVGLYDLLMPVGNTGLVFTAAVPGVLGVWSVAFTEAVQRAANLRAATTLIHMGLVRGESLTFIREAVGLSQQEMAVESDVPLATISSWENNIAVVPLHVWEKLSQQACLADGRSLPLHHALCPDWRPRVIRVFPNIPSRGIPQLNQNTGLGPYPQPFSSFPGADCYPPPRC